MHEKITGSLEVAMNHIPDILVLGRKYFRSDGELFSTWWNIKELPPGSDSYFYIRLLSSYGDVMDIKAVLVSQCEEFLGGNINKFIDKALGR